MTTAVAVFAGATVAVIGAGPRLARVAQEIADRTAIGAFVVGAILLGVVTSLPGLVLTVSAAARGDSELAVANALGGVAAQTVFLAIADIVYREGALSSRVPTRQVAFQAALLMMLLALVVVALGSPRRAVGRVHPVSVGIIGVYVGGLALSRRIARDSDARARTDPDEPDDPDDPDEPDRRDPPEGGHAGSRGKLGEVEPVTSREHHRSWRSLWIRFGAYAGLLSLAGYVLSRSGSEIAAATPLTSAGVGVALTSVATSTPELVTAVAAARRGAIGLAAGDIIGGNVFDTLFIATADVVDAGSVFAGAGSDALGFTGLAMLLNAILLSGVVRGGRRGRTDIESVAIIVLWLVGIAVALL